jgi:hypothetical protein
MCKHYSEDFIGSSMALKKNAFDGVVQARRAALIGDASGEGELNSILQLLHGNSLNKVRFVITVSPARF